MADPTQIYLHIGIPKTGTTALQAACTTGREALARQSICYPGAPGLPNHLLLAIYASDDPGNAPALRRGAAMLARRGVESSLNDPSIDTTSGKRPEPVDLFDEDAYLGFRKSFPELLRREILESACQKVVLSSEQLAQQLMSANEVQRVADLFGPISSDIRVVVYLRRQDELVLSRYSTAIKEGDFFDFRVEETNPTFNYRLLLEPWAQVFGKEALIVKVYEKGRLKDGDVVSDFFSMVGYKRDESVPIRSRNTRLDAATSTFLREFNRHVPRFIDSSLNPLRGGIAERLEEMSNGSSPVSWPGESLEEVVERFAESNAHVAREYLNVEDGKLFSDSPVAVYEDEPELSVDKAIEIAAHLWVSKERYIARLRERLAEQSRSGAGPGQTPDQANGT